MAPEDPMIIDSGELPVNILRSVIDEERGRYNFERWRSAFFPTQQGGPVVQAG
jgi:hypothetical protein